MLCLLYQGRSDEICPRDSDTDMLDLKSLNEKGFCEFGDNGFAIIKPYKIGERIS